MYDVLMIFTLFHTALSLVALGLGVPAILTLFGKKTGTCYTNAFLLFAVATTVTGFMFPFNGPTPAFVTGIVALLFFGLLFAAKYTFKLKGWWRTLYVGSLVASEFLLAFVTVAQSFQKIPALNAFAPTGSEPAFAITEGILLLAFIVLGVFATRRFKPAAKTVAARARPKAKAKRARR